MILMMARIVVDMTSMYAIRGHSLGMLHHRAFWLSLVPLACAVISFPLSAQERDSFYDKDFARSPLQKKNAPTKGRSSDLGPSGAVRSTPQSGDSLINQNGDEVLTIGLILNASEPEVARAVLRRALAFSLEHHVGFSEIFVIGNSHDAIPIIQMLEQPVPQSQMEALAIQGIARSMVRVVSKLPDGINAERAPSWILGTKKGRYLLDGVDSFESYVSAEGLFATRAQLGSSRSFDTADSEKHVASDSF
jgi:hypothetical protein